MSHLPVLPILLPMFAGALLLLLARLSMPHKRSLSLLATLLQLPLAVALLLAAEQGISVYALGNWAPPYGIVLVVDRLSALMLLLSAVLALPVVLYASRGDDALGPNFHALFQFQLMGINGAFLTGDLFNLFVFFEILLIASYALLVHGPGGARVRAGLHYVLLNLVGSALFLLALGTLYGVTGTLNMADMALRVALLDTDELYLAGAAGMLLLVVFSLKAALFPLYFWLPRAYASASAPVAALFAIMTKVGIYAIIRVFTLIFAETAGPLAGMAQAVLWPLALLTLVLGALGALAASSLPGILAYLVVLSVGVLLAGVAIGSEVALQAVLYYLLQSTWVAAGLFLFAGLLARARGPRFSARLVAGPPVAQRMLLGSVFFLGAIAIAGLPPLSGFIGKVLLLQSAGTGWAAACLYVVLLSSSLLVIIALSRAGSTLFWRQAGEMEASGEPLDHWRLLACLLLLASSVLLVILAAPVLDYLLAAVEQLANPMGYIDAVLSTTPFGGTP